MTDLGTLTCTGGLTAPITRLSLAEGCLVVEATAGPKDVGALTGRLSVLGPDGGHVFDGVRDWAVGVKTTFSAVWVITVKFRLPIRLEEVDGGSGFREL